MENDFCQVVYQMAFLPIIWVSQFCLFGAAKTIFGRHLDEFHPGLVPYWNPPTFHAQGHAILLVN